jgi:hypothetical protein
MRSVGRGHTRHPTGDNMITATTPTPEVLASCPHDRGTGIATMVVAAAVAVVMVLVPDTGVTAGVARVVTPASAPDTPCPGAPLNAAC